MFQQTSINSYIYKRILSVNRKSVPNGICNVVGWLVVGYSSFVIMSSNHILVWKVGGWSVRVCVRACASACASNDIAEVLFSFLL